MTTPSRSSNLSADEIRLSQSYQKLTSAEMAGRIQGLESRVAGRSYQPPALEVSHSIINEHLQAA